MGVPVVPASLFTRNGEFAEDPSTVNLASVAQIHSAVSGHTQAELEEDNLGHRSLGVRDNQLERSPIDVQLGAGRLDVE